MSSKAERRRAPGKVHRAVIIPTAAERAAIRRAQADIRAGRSVPADAFGKAAVTVKNGIMPRDSVRVLNALMAMERDPLARGASGVEGFPRTWCWSVGRYRIFYELDLENKKVNVLAIVKQK
jgi:hypothetical protein